MGRAKKQKDETPAAAIEPEQVVVETLAVVAETAQPVPEPRRRLSGFELKQQLRQHRRELRLAEKGY